METVIVLSILILIAIKNRRLESGQKKLLLIYLVVWAVGIILSGLELFEMRSPSVFSHNLILLHLVGFTIGALLIPTAKYNEVSNVNESITWEDKINHILNTSLFRVILVLMCIYATFLFISA